MVTRAALDPEDEQHPLPPSISRRSRRPPVEAMPSDSETTKQRRDEAGENNGPGVCLSWAELSEKEGVNQTLGPN